MAIPAALTLGVKDTFRFVPEIPEGTMTAFAYTSNKTKVAAVSASGVVTAKKAGTAIITVVTANGKKASCKVTVKAAPKAISLNVSSGTLGVGESYDLRYALTKKSAASVQFISSDPAVASVDPETGHVEALAPGSAVITARTHNGRTASCKVRVAPAPEAILLEEAAAVRIEVCRGTSCYIAGGTDLLAEIRRLTGCAVGERSEDGRYQVEYCECLGRCETAPNIVVNGRLYTSVTKESLESIIKEVQSC